MKKILLAALALPFILIACAEQGVIQDKTVIAQVETRLAQRAQWLPTLPDSMTKAEMQAMQFLYAYMPLGDVADYDARYYLSNVRASLDARNQMPWGDSVSEREFLHFVLPVRINNENLDSSRVVFYDELRDRVKGLSMHDAILEVNHWCHEKVNYSPSDARTMSPLASVRNATGRCGEESTFTVAALRAVGIPARQIYVPRWAHTDDNHAWVEAWAADATGGKWYYIGACEPEPVLNTGWFDAPAKRSLMMLTKVFGHYNGSDQVLSAADGYTEISVTENYTPIASRTLQVVDSLGDAVQGAEVSYTIYNYATYYPPTRIKTDAKGTTTLQAGLGDMVVFAAKDGKTASAVIDFRVKDTLKLTLGDMQSGVTDWDIVPPAQAAVDVAVSKEARDKNNARFAAEDSIRTAYINTFITQAASDSLASTMGADAKRVWDVMSKTRGNHQSVAQFLQQTSKENIPTALALLETVSIKDLRDTPCEVFTEHLAGALKYSDRPYFVEYILNPRIDNEMLRPYRTALYREGATAESIIQSARTIKVADSLNPGRFAISAVGVQSLGMGDRASVERLLISTLRSNGIAARREPLSRRVQYLKDNHWVYVNLFDDKTEVPAKGKLVVTLAKNPISDDPKLDTHFSLSKWNGQRWEQIQFEILGVDMGGAATWSNVFKAPMPIESGRYMLTSGTRLADGTVMARNVVFDIQQGQTTTVELTMRNSETEIQVIGSLDAEQKYIKQGECSPGTLLATTGRGYFILAMIDAKKEPTTHMMRDLAREKKKLEAWGRPIVLVMRDKTQLDALNLKDFPELPSTVTFGYDMDGQMSGMIASMMKIQDMSRLPVVLVGDTFGRVVFQSTGYNTSLGEQLAALVAKL